MKIAVIGCGSIGKRHIRNLKELLTKRNGEVIAFDVNEEALKVVKEEIDVKTSSNYEEVLKEVDGVFICTPNHLHIKLALQAVQNDCHVLIEKPLSHSMENVDELLRIAKEKNLTVTVGYMMRFYEPLKIVKKLLDEKRIGKVYGARIEFGSYLPDWRPTQDYRANYGSIRAQGGGVILDVIHEINYMKWLFGELKELRCIGGTLSDLEMDTEDYVEINAKTKDDLILNLHLDYLQQDYSRSCKIIGENGTIVWDFRNHSVKLFDKEKREWKTLIEIKDLDFNTIYMAEEDHFLDCVAGTSKAVVNGDESKDDLIVALAALKSMNENSIIKF